MISLRILADRGDAFKMKEKEKELLENLFDSLDRLFDRHCQICDVHDCHRNCS